MLAFDRAYYLAQNPDVAVLGVDPEAHYASIGYLEGRNPCVGFDTAYYIEQNPDVLFLDVSPLDHFNAIGFLEGRNPCAGVDAALMFAASSDGMLHDVLGDMPQVAVFDTVFYCAVNAPVVVHESALVVDEMDDETLEFDGAQWLNAMIMTYAGTLMAHDQVDALAIEADEPPVMHSDVPAVDGVLVVVGDAAAKQLQADVVMFAPDASNDNHADKRMDFAVQQNLYVPTSTQVRLAGLTRAVRGSDLSAHSFHDPTLFYRAAQGDSVSLSRLTQWNAEHQLSSVFLSDKLRA